MLSTRDSLDSHLPMSSGRLGDRVDYRRLQYSTIPGSQVSFRHTVNGRHNLHLLHNLECNQPKETFSTKYLLDHHPLTTNGLISLREMCSIQVSVQNCLQMLDNQSQEDQKLFVRVDHQQLVIMRSLTKTSWVSCLLINSSETLPIHYNGHLPTDKQSRIRPPESRQPGTQNDVFNEAFMGELSTDPQPTQRPRSLSRDPLNEAFIRKSSTDNQSKGRIPCIAKSRSKRRDPLVIGQLPKDQSRLQTSYGVGSQSFSTPKAAFNRGFRGQLSVDVQSTPSRGGYKKADTGPSNPRLRLCGK
ncbi:unnamed protein product [Acanthoscelides obtectus]|uniref:Uncharacterized protein n=1 Tax=Acanthoscelides obtectus TaxID=200917 RepID=A0A9P0PZS1_ACAOB|nr:unnamed protein product [Acanthoscelides obtectus]CAK1664145.1 hypothetical protein AOBTE_LOCUS24080 [Acanthoscelides obtectus]